MATSKLVSKRPQCRRRGVALPRPFFLHLGILEITTDAGVLAYLFSLIMVARWMLVSNTAGQSVATTFLCIALLAICPLSSVLSMYSFATGSITRPALALALGAHFRKAD